MRPMRLLFTVLAISVVGAGSALACDQEKNTATAASAGGSKDAACCASKSATKGATKTAVASASQKGVCTAEMAATCTREMAANCPHGMKGTAASSVSEGCAMHGTMTTAVAASASGARGKVNAVAVGAGGSCSAHKGTMASGSMESCSAHKGAMAAGAGGKCDGHGMVMQGMTAHADCNACTDMANCESDLEAAGARAQIVALKNGVMYVYTAETPDKVRAIQTAVSRRNSRMLSAVSAADKAHLCTECKLMRGAMASGKLSREVVNVETGCLTLVTSNDRAMIEKIHAMAGPQLAARVKS